MTIEYDLQHADWIAANVPGEKRSINDKVVMNLAAEVRRLRDVMLADRAAFENVYETHTNQLRAKLRRVEALVVGWREGEHGDCYPRERAAELEAALRGDE